MTALSARFGLWSAALLVLIAVFALRVAGQVRIETDVLAMLPEVERDPAVDVALREFSEQAGRKTLFLVGAAQESAAHSAASAFAGTLRSNGGFADVRLEVQDGVRDALATVRAYRGVLLSARDRDLLATGHGEALFQQMMRALYTPAGMIRAVPASEDPLGLMGDFLLQQLPPMGAVTLSGGVLVTSGEGRRWVLVVAETRDSPFASATQEQVMPAVESATAAARAAGAEVLSSGLLPHAAYAARKAHQELSTFGTLSLIGTILLLLFVHRSMRPVMMSAGSIALGVLAALTVCQLWFGKVHVLTLVFGSSLAGVAADYSTYFLTDAFRVPGRWDPRTAPAQVAPGILLGLVTALVAYGALMATPFPGLRQIAAFSAVGLFTACGCVLCLFPLLRPPQAPPVAPLVERALAALQPRPFGRTQLALLLVLALAGAAGATRLHLVNDLRLLQASPRQLVESEQRLRALMKNPTDSQFLLVTGETPEAVLEHEEALRPRLDALQAQGTIASYAAVTRALPSRRVQDENAALLLAQVCGAHGLLPRALTQMGYARAAIASRTRECEQQTRARFEPQAWLGSPASAAYRHLWLGAVPGGFASVVTLGAIRELAPLRTAAMAVPGVRLVDKVGDISALMARFQRLVAAIVLLSHLGLFAIFSLRYGARDALRVVASPALACLGAIGLFGLLGEPFNLFSTFALLLVLGIGIDYAIFLREGRSSPRSSLIAVLVSASTALLSFGMLAFSGTPFIHSIGLTLLCGISLAVLSALLLAGTPKTV